MYEQLNKKGKCWSAEKAQEWYKKFPLIVGVNYLPRTAVNSTDMWQSSTFDEQTIKQELKWAHECGYNCVRVFLPFIVYQNEPKIFKCNFDKFLTYCDCNKIKVVPTLFDDCAFANLEPYLGQQNKPVPLVHNSGWTPSPSVNEKNNLTAYPKLKNYVQDMVGTFCLDQRILMWDLYNECGNNSQGSKSIYLLNKSFEWAREISPSQPLTACMWAFENGAAVKDSYFCDMAALENSDIITYHQYSDTTQYERIIAELKQIGYPIICTEWMARVFFNSTIQTLLPLYKRDNVGSIHWGLVNGKTQTHIPWGWDITKGEPSVWFHDVLRSDGTPYDKKEIAIIKNIQSVI